VNEKFHECIDLCNRQIELTPNDFFSFYYRGQCNTNLKLYDDALEDFNMALTNGSKNSFPKMVQDRMEEVEIRIANILRRKRDYKDALKSLERTIETYPKSSGAFIEKAGILSDLNRFEEALDNVNVAITLSPKNKNLLDFKTDLINIISS
jgi:tetratricopeptide (TPR) repeat protein